MSVNTPENFSDGPREPASNRQAGRELVPPDPVDAGRIATGDRREEVHFERKETQLVARHLVRPDRPLPAEMNAPGAIAAAEADAPPIEDVAVPLEESSSVWDARPPAGR